MSLKHKDYKEANIRFLEENLEKEGVMELPCGIQYKILLKGTHCQKHGKGTLPGNINRWQSIRRFICTQTPGNF